MLLFLVTGMVYFRPGLFKPCHYLVSADGKSQRYRHIKGYESRLYIVRRVSPLSARVLPDFGPNSCMVWEYECYKISLNRIKRGNRYLHRRIKWFQ